MGTFGLDVREEVHEIEFLALFAFLIRERERLRSHVNPRSRGMFTRNDLEMAYAFHRQLGHHGRQNPAYHPLKPESHQESPHQRQSDLQHNTSYCLPKSRTEDVLGGKMSPPPPTKMAGESVRVPQQYLSGGVKFRPPEQLFQRLPQHSHGLASRTMGPPQSPHRTTAADLHRSTEEQHMLLGERLRTAGETISLSLTPILLCSLLKKAIMHHKVKF